MWTYVHATSMVQCTGWSLMVILYIYLSRLYRPLQANPCVGCSQEGFSGARVSQALQTNLTSVRIALIRSVHWKRSALDVACETTSVRNTEISVLGPIARLHLHHSSFACEIVRYSDLYGHYNLCRDRIQTSCVHMHTVPVAGLPFFHCRSEHSSASRDSDRDPCPRLS